MRKLNILFFFLLSVNITGQNFSDGFNFYISPYNELNSEFLPTFDKTAILQYGFIYATDDGKFANAEGPIRFWGVNIVADGAVPDKNLASDISKRIRTLGINLVRFHHLDNSWATGSLFYNMPNTRSLNQGNLDKLDNLIAALGDEGIYYNMNLNVGRTFKISDGVPSADSIPDFGKGVTLFDPYLLKLQKEYAQQILVHINPYNQKTYLNDPAMAMVEIANENSLYFMYINDKLTTLDNSGSLTYYHNSMLNHQWIDYLLLKYGSTGNLRSVWLAGHPGGSNILTNPGFEQTISLPWSLELHSPAVATLINDPTDAVSGNYCARVTVSNTDGIDWHAQLKHSSINLVKDSNYTVRFYAKSNAPRSIYASVIKDITPYNSYGGMSAELSSEWKEFSFTISATENTSSGRLTFSLGGATGTFKFDDVSMSFSGMEGLREWETLEAGNVERIKYKDRLMFDEHRTTDLIDFYLQTQKKFFDNMYRYLKDTLGVKVPIVSTNWNFGPPDRYIQSNYDYVDNHAYWDHPSFSGEPWSSTDWLINNTPMVRSNDWNTMAGIFSGSAVKNKPYTISEYNHPFPNRYQSEGMLFLTAYSSLHDADGIMIFDYNSGYNWTTDKIANYFSIHRNPVMTGLLPSCGYAYRKGMISESQTEYTFSYKYEDVLNYPLTGERLFDNRLSLRSRINADSYEAASTSLASSFPPVSNPYFSDTGELYLNTSSGILKVDSEQFLGVTGQLDQNLPIFSKFAKVTEASGFATVTWVSLTDSALNNSSRSFITLSTVSQNTNMIWDGINTIHNNWGNAPTLIKPASLKIQFSLGGDSLKIYPLLPDGSLKSHVYTYYPDQNGVYDVIIDSGTDKTIWFGMERFGMASTGVDDGKKIGNFRLGQNFPNPFNPTTNISYEIDANGAHVKITIYDILGREAATLINANQAAGLHSLEFNAADLSSGIYFYRIDAYGDNGTVFTDVKKMTIIK